MSCSRFGFCANMGEVFLSRMGTQLYLLIAGKCNSLQRIFTFLLTSTASERLFVFTVVWSQTCRFRSVTAEFYGSAVFWYCSNADEYGVTFCCPGSCLPLKCSPWVTLPVTKTWFSLQPWYRPRPHIWKVQSWIFTLDNSGKVPVDLLAFPLAKKNSYAKK